MCPCDNTTPGLPARRPGVAWGSARLFDCLAPRLALVFAERLSLSFVRDAECDGLVVTLAELRERFRIEGRVAAGQGVFDGFVCLAEDFDHVGGPRLQPAGTEIGDRAHRRMTCWQHCWTPASCGRSC